MYTILTSLFIPLPDYSNLKIIPKPILFLVIHIRNSPKQMMTCISRGPSMAKNPIYDVLVFDERQSLRVSPLHDLFQKDLVESAGVGCLMALFPT